ncbi:hypothetical protein [Flavobacterium sp.]|uniref:hypothetical protein n=1 Tax=Flavobacterium sp. TaxID=239 RepID=UPI0026382B3F|nr:hypothetical protein [Flavobacterium sp.]MDG2431301.1 hypothetical protein [Flavobacterium sp.]
MILNPLSPSFLAYLVHCKSISVSVNSSVGKCVVSFTIVLLLSSNAFLALILERDKAEYLGLLSSGFGIEGTVFGSIIFFSSLVFEDF